MKDTCRQALDAAMHAGADYADARVLLVDEQWLAAKNAEVVAVAENESVGAAIRVLAGGAWGFAASSDLSADGLARTAAAAVANARAAGRQRRRPIELAPEPVHHGRFETPVKLDPAAVDLDLKLGLLTEVTAVLQKEPAVRVAEAMMSFRREEQCFLTSEGTAIEQTLQFSGAGLSAISTGPGGVQKRSYPNSWGGHITGGYELIDELDLLAVAPRIAAEAAALQQADVCPAGLYDLVLDSRQLDLQIHESVGHPLELDRVLGGEADYAGTSFATTDRLGSLRYGSDWVNLTADATLPRGVGSFGYDDEGVAAQKWPLVEGGVLCGYLTSREYADASGESRSRGAMRAEGWRHVPIIRMVNLSLEPGPDPLTLEELIADTKHGLFMSTNRSWSIDQRRVNFQFGCEIAWEIDHGKLTRMLRNPVYQGLTTEFWSSCDAICDEREWRLHGLMNCGKGQPAQIAEMSHGAAPARFRQVRCGVDG